MVKEKSTSTSATPQVDSSEREVPRSSNLLGHDPFDVMLGLTPDDTSKLDEVLRTGPDAAEKYIRLVAKNIYG